MNRTATGIQADRPCQLKELDIYKTPDGRRFVASTLYDEGYCLYSLGAWQTAGTAEYRVSANGEIFRRATPTGWRVQDLIRTGETATYPRYAKGVL